MAPKLFDASRFADIDVVLCIQFFAEERKETAGMAMLEYRKNIKGEPDFPKLIYTGTFNAPEPKQKLKVLKEVLFHVPKGKNAGVLINFPTTPEIKEGLRLRHYHCSLPHAIEIYGWLIMANLLGYPTFPYRYDQWQNIIDEVRLIPSRLRSRSMRILFSNLFKVQRNLLPLVVVEAAVMGYSVGVKVGKAQRT